MAEILVLDDVQDAAIMVRRILEKKGHHAHVFNDEDEALRFAADHGLDLAIVDVKLRKMDGTEVLAELRKMQPGLPVIMLTGFPTMDAAMRSLDLGAVAYCAKPIDKNDLEKTVAAALAPGSPSIR